MPIYVPISVFCGLVPERSCCSVLIDFCISLDVYPEVVNELDVEMHNNLGNPNVKMTLRRIQS